MLIHFTLNVVPHSKKNSSQICRLKNGRTLLLPSKLYKKFEDECLSLIGDDLKLNISNPITVQAHFYCKTRRKIDLTNLLEALDDMLVKAGVIKDDCRDVVASHDGSRVYYDKENPRIEIWIEDFKEEYVIWKKEDDIKKISKK